MEENAIFERFFKKLVAKFGAVVVVEWQLG